MNVQFAQPPPAVAQAVRARLSSVQDNAANGGSGGSHALRYARAPAALSLADPHEVYTLGLDDLRTGTTVRTVQPSGWRFLLRQENEAIASAETMVDEAGVHQFASFNRGPYVEATQDALDAAFGIDADPDVQYEPRLLDVPALHARALWLHEPNPSGDKAIPMAPAPDGIEPRGVYDFDAYVEILRGLARDLGDFSDEDGLGG